MTPRDGSHAQAYKVTVSPWFESGMMAVILANIFFMLLVHEGQSDRWSFMLSVANTVFTGIFVAEFLLKWLAVGAGVHACMRPAQGGRVGGIGGGRPSERALTKHCG